MLQQGPTTLAELFEGHTGPDISLFIPCLNEEKRVVGAIEKVATACRNTGRSFEIMVFDDGSTDRTYDVVRAYQAAHTEIPIRLFRREKNRGLSYNFTDGAFFGAGRYYRCVAGDDYESLESHEAILRELGNADIIVPVYEEVENRGFTRTFISKTYTWLANRASGNRIDYYNGFAVYRRWHVLRYSVEGTGFGFQAEIITRLLNEGMSYKQLYLKATYGGVTTAFTVRNFVSVSYSLFKIAMRRLRIRLFK